jgi:hypothetical protein
MQLDMIDAQEPDVFSLFQISISLIKQVSDYHYVPETVKYSGSIKACLQDSEDIPKDFTKLFDLNLFSFNTRMVPEVIDVYEV